MMTFEEFFAKKKIDLTVLLAENPSLYREFEDHYAQMGPKSFDHTKKFWFNKLRKTYLLKEISPDLGEQTTTQASKPSTPPIQQQSTVPTTFKPRFKAAAAPLQKAAIEQQEVQKETTEKAAKPTGFKPRFKAELTKPKNNSEGTQ